MKTFSSSLRALVLKWWICHNIVQFFICVLHLYSQNIVWLPAPFKLPHRTLFYLSIGIISDYPLSFIHLTIPIEVVLFKLHVKPLLVGSAIVYQIHNMIEKGQHTGNAKFEGFDFSFRSGRQEPTLRPHSVSRQRDLLALRSQSLLILYLSVCLSVYLSLHLVS